MFQETYRITLLNFIKFTNPLPVPEIAGVRKFKRKSGTGRIDYKLDIDDFTQIFDELGLYVIHIKECIQDHKRRAFVSKKSLVSINKKWKNIEK